ncbi:MFS transporter [Microbacterium sp. NEAU-LLC]|uniref:MFS transporter n=1 Tax=Microbacterium helvum TaxID=2773713 RepID=A0ABR8NQX2_9MICO|nr:MFS transporter [Microbacterium helvum]
MVGPFRERNFTLYFVGQTVSLTGTWFQTLALSLVVLEATGSARALSGVTIAQFLPMIVLSIPAGRLADRFAPRTVLMCTSLVSAAVVGILALVVSATEPDLRAIYALVAVLGCAQAFERVTAQAIIFELAGPRELTTAVALSTITIGVSRSIGPGLAGVVFQVYGPVTGMVINSASFIVVFLSLVLIRPGRLYARTPATKTPGVAPPRLWADRSIVTLLIVNVVIALLAMNFLVTLTTVVTIDFGADAAAVGAAHALNAVGGIIGGVVAAALPHVSVRSPAMALTVFGGSVLLNAAAPTLTWFLLAAPLLGFGIGCYNGVLNAAAQASVPPERIGRLMSLVNIGSYGMVPFGALLLGWIIDLSSGRVALAVGGATALAAAAFVRWRLRRDPAVDDPAVAADS